MCLCLCIPRFFDVLTFRVPFYLHLDYPHYTTQNIIYSPTLPSYTNARRYS